MTCGIYTLNFKGTDKLYIGLSINIEARYRHHIYALKNNIAPEKLQHAYSTFGEPYYKILIEATVDELESLEKEAIDIFNSIENGFNSREGGAVGASLTIQGEKNGRAKHTEEIYLSIFFDILNTKDSYKIIASRYNVSIQVVDHIALGISHKTWISSMFPEEYKKLAKVVKERKLIYMELVNINTNEEIVVTSIINFSKESGIAKSTLSGLKTGALTVAGPWRLKYPIDYNPSIKPTYKVLNNITKETVEFKNILKFCRDFSISNRKGFTKAIKNLNNYNEWVVIDCTP